MEICSVNKILPTLIISKCVQTRSTCPLPAAKNTFNLSGQPGSKTIKLEHNKRMWTILCKFGRNFWYVLWKDFVPSPVEHCFSSGIRTHRFCFLSHPSLPNKMIEPSKPRNALKLCFYFLLCISLTSQTLFKNLERVFVFCQPAKQTYGPEHKMTESWKSRHLQSSMIDFACMDRNLCWGISSWEA